MSQKSLIQFPSLLSVKQIDGEEGTQTSQNTDNANKKKNLRKFPGSQG